ncbi:hypothetical protein Ccrd_003297 [Cynara cardunculus var. scolymus]|uniref:Uncharacterized protein n=1 Tax=Cynara cardunculus var. scolymus TaxID=59895 RepID=A0A103XPS1_CYNCS|nr:hypothetical protein Ccrd_003297 [Cynara cardunculus var. scolymus]
MSNRVEKWKSASRNRFSKNGALWVPLRMPRTNMSGLICLINCKTESLGLLSTTVSSWIFRSRLIELTTVNSFLSIFRSSILISSHFIAIPLYLNGTLNLLQYFARRLPVSSTRSAGRNPGCGRSMPRTIEVRDRIAADLPRTVLADPNLLPRSLPVSHLAVLLRKDFSFCYYSSYDNHRYRLKKPKWKPPGRRGMWKEDNQLAFSHLARLFNRQTGWSGGQEDSKLELREKIDLVGTLQMVVEYNAEETVYTLGKFIDGVLRLTYSRVKWTTIESEDDDHGNHEEETTGAKLDANKKTLTWWDLIWFGMGAVVGAGIFVLTGLARRFEVTGPSIVEKILE